MNNVWACEQVANTSGALKAFSPPIVWWWKFVFSCHGILSKRKTTWSSRQPTVKFSAKRSKKKVVLSWNPHVPSRIIRIVFRASLLKNIHWIRLHRSSGGPCSVCLEWTVNWPITARFQLGMKNKKIFDLQEDGTSRPQCAKCVCYLTVISQRWPGADSVSCGFCVFNCSFGEVAGFWWWTVWQML